MPLMLPAEFLGLGGIVAALRGVAHRRQLRRGEQLQLPHEPFSRRSTPPRHFRSSQPAMSFTGSEDSKAFS
jgi:hypothetical protein